MVAIIINIGRSRDEILQYQLRELAYLSTKHQFITKAQHISGVTNRIPDLLGRWDQSESIRMEFRARTSNMDLIENEVDEKLLLFSHDW